MLRPSLRPFKLPFVGHEFDRERSFIELHYRQSFGIGNRGLPTLRQSLINQERAEGLNVSTKVGQ